MRAWWLVLGALSAYAGCGGDAFSSGHDEASAGSAGKGGSASVGGSSAAGSSGGGKQAGGGGGRGGNAGSGNPAGGAPHAGNGGNENGAGGSGTAGEGGAAGDGGSGGDVSCPDEIPEEGEDCSGSLDCSFGDHPLASCRTRAACEGGAWVVTGPEVACAEVGSCLEELETVPVVNTACATAGVGCFLDESIYCRCVPCDGTCAAESVWDCRGPSALSCPDRLPNEGTSCNGADATCTYYGSCAFGESTSATCTSGMWAWTSLDCAE